MSEQSTGTDACSLIDLPEGVLLQVFQALSPRQVGPGISSGPGNPDDKDG
jgi:hypothetical protein